MIVDKARLLKKKVKGVLYPQTEFSKRIKFRYANFWDKGFGQDIPSWPLLGAKDAFNSLWEIKNWERQLENKHNSGEIVETYTRRVPDLYWQSRDYSSS